MTGSKIVACARRSETAVCFKRRLDMIISTHHPLGTSAWNRWGFRKRNEERTDGLEVMDWMGLGGKISEIVFPGPPDSLEVALFNSILDPVVAHVDGFAATDLGGTVGNTPRGFIVVGECRGGLRVTEISERLAVDFSILCIHE